MELLTDTYALKPSGKPRQSWYSNATIPHTLHRHFLPCLFLDDTAWNYIWLFPGTATPRWSWSCPSRSAIQAGGSYRRKKSYIRVALQRICHQHIVHSIRGHSAHFLLSTLPVRLMIFLIDLIVFMYIKQTKFNQMIRYTWTTGIVSSHSLVYDALSLHYGLGKHFLMFASLPFYYLLVMYE